MNMDLETKAIHVIIPKSHLALIIANYLFQMEIIGEETKIASMNIPIDCDEDGNIEITVGILKEQLN